MPLKPTKEERAQNVTQMNANSQLEGIGPDASDVVIQADYINGSKTIADLIDHAQAAVPVEKSLQSPYSQRRPGASAGGSPLRSALRLAPNPNPFRLKSCYGRRQSVFALSHCYRLQPLEFESRLQVKTDSRKRWRRSRVRFARAFPRSVRALRAYVPHAASVTALDRCLRFQLPMPLLRDANSRSS